MNKLYTKCLKLVAVLCLLLSSAQAQAQWEMVRQCNAAYAVHVTKSGNLLLSDYLFDNNGGIYLSTDEGKTWEKTDIMDHNYNSFIEAGDYIFAAGIGGYLARSADEGKNWELVYFSEPFKPFLSQEELDYDVAYAMAYHNGKLFVGDFCGGGIVYTEDFGETWTLTKRDHLKWATEDKETGEPVEYVDNFYNMVSFKGKLYAFGMINVYVYDDETNDWSILRDDSNFMAVSTIFKDKLYCGRSTMSETYRAPFLECTEDGKTWNEVPRPLELMDNNVRALSSDDKNIYAALQSRGIYYTNDEGANWYDISEGIPPYSEDHTERFLSPLRFAITDDYVYVVIYEDPFSVRNVSGLYRYAKKNLPTGIGDIVAGQSPVVYSEGCLFVGAEAAAVAVYDVSGKKCPVVLDNGKVDVRGLQTGCYLYEVQFGSEKVSGKFIKK